MKNRPRLNSRVKINYSDSGVLNPKALTIYCAGTNDFTTGEFKLAGNVFVKEARVTIGGSSQIHGSLLTNGSKDIKVDGGGSLNGNLCAKCESDFGR